MTRDADLDAGRRKLEEFKKAKDKHRDATPSDVEAEQKKEKPEKMKKTSDAGKTDDETAAIKAKLVKAVKKGKAIESKRDAAKARAQALEKEIEGLKKTAEASASGERAAAETRDELESMREQLVRNTEALTYANEESHRAAEEARARIAAIEEELEKNCGRIRGARKAPNAKNKNVGVPTDLDPSLHPRRGSCTVSTPGKSSQNFLSQTAQRRANLASSAAKCATG